MALLVTVSGTALVTAREPDPDRRVCPYSGTRGLGVAVDPTVGQHVSAATWDQLVGLDSLWYCPDADCPVVYFDGDHEHLWGVAELRTVVGVKANLDPIPVCYCRRVTAAQIKYEILEEGCCTSLQDVKAFTDANTGELCRITNPSGRCCGAHLKRVVTEILAAASAGSVPHDLARVATECASCIPDES